MLGKIISIILLYFAYAYLKGLKTCECANQLYATRLKNLEAILLGFNVFILAFAVLSSFKIINVLDKLKQHILKIAMLGGITMLLFYSVFIFNGYKFWNTLPVVCSCANKWEKYYIYFQTIFFFLITLFTTLFVGGLAFHKIKAPASMVKSIMTKSIRSSKRK